MTVTSKSYPQFVLFPEYLYLIFLKTFPTGILNLTCLNYNVLFSSETKFFLNSLLIYGCTLLILKIPKSYSPSIFNVFRSHHVGTLHLLCYHHNAKSCHPVPEYCPNWMSEYSISSLSVKSYFFRNIFAHLHLLSTTCPSLMLLVNILVIKCRTEDTLNTAFFLSFKNK